MLLGSTLDLVESADGVVLVHGWGGSFETTWQSTGFSALLEDAGRSVIGVDLLGHGTAPKPHDPAQYDDLTERVVDALPGEPVSGVGFSLGALTLLRTAIHNPGRFDRLVLAGIGRNVFERDHSGAAAIAGGLRAALAGDDMSTLDNTVRLFTQYASQPGNDLEALLAVMERPPAFEIDRDGMSGVTCPVLVVVGENDFVHPADELAAAFPDGRVVNLPRTDHFATPESFAFFDAALEFLGALP